MTSARDQHAKEGFRDYPNVQIQIGAYRFQDWQKLLEMKNPTCKEKMDLAYKLDYHRVPIDGSENERLVLKTERNWYHPEMYFIAIMDCHENIQNTLGPNPYGRIMITADMKDDDTEFSYENQGSLETDMVLLLVYIVLIVISVSGRVKFEEQNQSLHNPFWYCILGMGF